MDRTAGGYVSLHPHAREGRSASGHGDARVRPGRAGVGQRPADASGAAHRAARGAGRGSRDVARVADLGPRRFELGEPGEELRVEDLGVADQRLASQEAVDPAHDRPADALDQDPAQQALRTEPSVSCDELHARIPPSAAGAF